MDDENRSEENHLDELMELHHRIIELDKLEIERKRAENNLREIEDKIHKLFDKAEGVITIIQDRLIKYVNPVILISLFVMVIHENITSRYENYSIFALLVGGVALALLAFSLSFVFMKLKGEKTI